MSRSKLAGIKRTGKRKVVRGTGAASFLPGTAPGPGRPSRPVEKNYLRALCDVCPLDAWGEIVRRAVKDARAGDANAREWLAKYLLGDKATLGTPYPGRESAVTAAAPCLRAAFCARTTSSTTLSTVLPWLTRSKRALTPRKSLEESLEDEKFCFVNLRSKESGVVREGTFHRERPDRATSLVSAWSPRPTLIIMFSRGLRRRRGRWSSPAATTSGSRKKGVKN